MIKYLEENCDGLVAVKVVKNLNKNDLKDLAVEFQNQIKQHVRINLFFELESPTEEYLKGEWDDFNFILKHSGDVKRIALVGDEEYKAPMEEMVNIFSAAEIIFFPKSSREEAMEWVKIKC